jgi:hypothetical protein
MDHGDRLVDGLPCCKYDDADGGSKEDAAQFDITQRRRRPFEILGKKSYNHFAVCRGMTESSKGSTANVMKRPESGALGSDYIVEGRKDRLHRRATSRLFLELT